MRQATAHRNHCSPETNVSHTHTHTHLLTLYVKCINVCECCKPIQNDISYKPWVHIKFMAEIEKARLKAICVLLCVCVCVCGFCAFSCSLLDFRIGELLFPYQFQMIFLFNEHTHTHISNSHFAIAVFSFRFSCAHRVNEWVNVYKYFLWHILDVFSLHHQNVYCILTQGVYILCNFTILCGASVGCGCVCVCQWDELRWEMCFCDDICFVYFPVPCVLAWTTNERSPKLSKIIELFGFGMVEKATESYAPYNIHFSSDPVKFN